MGKAQEIFREAGFKVLDNRNLEWKAVNQAISNGIELKIAKKGFILVEGELRYSTKVSCTVGGIKYTSRYNPNYDTTADIVGAKAMNCIAQFCAELRNRNISFATNYNDSCKCQNCGGKGIIPAFMHIANGVCFSCLGTGYNGVK